MMKKSCMTLLGVYLLHRKTEFNFKLFPRDGVLQLQNVYAEDPTHLFEPQDFYIKNFCTKTRLYGKPKRTIEELKQLVRNHPVINDEPWPSESQKIPEIYNDWPEPPRRMRFLHFYAAPECDDQNRLTERGRLQAGQIVKKVMEEYPEDSKHHSIVTVSMDPRCQTVVRLPEFQRKNFTSSDEYLVDGFPVDRLDPPHSDVIVPRDWNAEEDKWQMEYAFRKICHFPPCSFEKTNSIEHFVLPKNLIAYVVQRAMQFKPETFGRFRISDGSHTYVKIRANGYGIVITIGETTHLSKEYNKQNLQGDGDDDIGLDVPVDDEFFDCPDDLYFEDEDSVDNNCALM